VHKRILSAGKKDEFVGYRMPYINLAGSWCDITVLNEHDLTQDKASAMNENVYLKDSLNTIRNFIRVQWQSK
jgi:hypothetical protein